jgi:hypothetical protein
VGFGEAQIALVGPREQAAHTAMIAYQKRSWQLLNGSVFLLALCSQIWAGVCPDLVTDQPASCQS